MTTLGSETRAAIFGLIRDLVSENWASLENKGALQRVTETEIERVVSEYGRTLVELPASGFDLADVVPLDAQPGVFSVDIPLWTKEEGRSDLTLSLTIRETPRAVRVEIDDLHVL